jgi:hypothetical protein
MIHILSEAIRTIEILRCKAEKAQVPCTSGRGFWMCHQNPRPAVGYQHDWPEGPRFSGFGRRIEDVHMARVAFNAYSHIFTKDVSNHFD